MQVCKLVSDLLQCCLLPKDMLHTPVFSAESLKYISQERGRKIASFQDLKTLSSAQIV